MAETSLTTPTATAVLDAGREARAQMKSKSNAARAWRRFRQNRLALAGLVIVALMGIMALGAPLISQYITHVSLSKQSLLAKYAPAGTKGSAGSVYYFGTDELGRDIFTRIAYGAQVSLGVALLAATVAVTVGTVVGAVAAYYGGWVDAVLMRFVDVMLCIPSLVLLILVGALVHVGPQILALIIALLGWFGLSRLIRAEILSVRKREYVEAARVIGARDRIIIFRHILPNVTHIIIIFATGAIPTFILEEAALSFLGLGIQPPTPSWGNMLTNALAALYQSPGVAFYPGFFIAITVLALIVVGNALRDALDPRLTK